MGLYPKINSLENKIGKKLPSNTVVDEITLICVLPNLSYGRVEFKRIHKDRELRLDMSVSGSIVYLTATIYKDANGVYIHNKTGVNWGKGAVSINETMTPDYHFTHNGIKANSFLGIGFHEFKTRENYRLNGKDVSYMEGASFPPSDTIHTIGINCVLPNGKLGFVELSGHEIKPLKSPSR